MVEYLREITRGYIAKNPDKLFVFGDNERRAGFGGQATQMRGAPNAIGVCTKVSPCTGSTCYWNDARYELNKHFIDLDITKIKEAMQNLKYKALVFPGTSKSDIWIGNGLSELPTRAPKTWAYLQKTLSELANYYET